MEIVAYLNFDGECADAFRFYASTLGGELQMQTQGESPMTDQAGPGSRDRILHARLEVGDALLMGSDSPVNGHERPQGFAVSITVDDPAEADWIFNALAEGGSVTMPIGETFWAARFGMVTDRFGTPWIVNANRPTAG